MPIDYEKRDGVAYITLNNPEKANILDKPTSDDISAAWIDLWEDKNIRCAIVTGKGDKHFCGGHNLTPRPDLTEKDREYLRLQKVYWPLAGTVHGQTTGVDGRMGDHYPRVWKPVIAAVNGWAAGAGLYLLLSSTDKRSTASKSECEKRKASPRLSTIRPARRRSGAGVSEAKWSTRRGAC